MTFPRQLYPGLDKLAFLPTPGISPSLVHPIAWANRIQMGTVCGFCCLTKTSVVKPCTGARFRLASVDLPVRWEPNDNDPSIGRRRSAAEWRGQSNSLRSVARRRRLSTFWRASDSTPANEFHGRSAVDAICRLGSRAGVGRLQKPAARRQTICGPSHKPRRVTTPAPTLSNNLP
jgi:hypothetical protein